MLRHPNFRRVEAQECMQRLDILSGVGTPFPPLTPFLRVAKVIFRLSFVPLCVLCG